MNDIFNDNVPLKTETPAFAKHVLPEVPSSELDLFGCSKIKKETFTESFLVPPFSVLDTKQPYWQKRKKVWKNLILDDGSKRAGKLAKRTDNWNEESETFEIVSKFDVSILDPVLSEVLLKWFAFENCKTFDPFAGDTVFGYVSSFLGNEFTGIELRQEQVDFNTEKTKGLKAKYVCDDAVNIINHIHENSQDFLFSCPPYFDLEKYSQLPNDASNQKEYKDFLQILNVAFSNAIKCLKENRFACIVIGDVRDKKGYYRRLPHHICNIFEANGMKLYNEIIMLEMIGRKALTANRNFITRKNPKTHQNVLVFYKGDEKKIKEIFKKLR
jgi:DNA modification methylase